MLNCTVFFAGFFIIPWWEIYHHMVYHNFIFKNQSCVKLPTSQLICCDLTPFAKRVHTASIIYHPNINEETVWRIFIFSQVINVNCNVDSLEVFLGGWYFLALINNCGDVLSDDTVAGVNSVHECSCCRQDTPGWIHLISLSMHYNK